nr:UDP-glucose/GDP-mannose dehydrogenase family protein [Candidatus Bathyarchaeota archaeon]
MRLSIFGLGHVGLTLAACLADNGFQVLGYDVDEKKSHMISNGRVPFHEPGLDILIGKAISSKRLCLTSDPEEAVLSSDITFITVGTPEKPDGSADLTYVDEALKSIGSALSRKKDYHLVVLRSTVPPGTSREAVKALEKISGKKGEENFGFCFNPEFLREGNAVQDTLYPDRIIIGELDKKSGDLLEDFYKRFHSSKMPPLLRTTLENAELIKYAANAFLAMKVSFINMIARLCERIPHADVEVVAKGVGLDKRIGAYFLKAGLGFGGSCFPKDLKALLAYAKRLNVRLPLVEATLQINEDQPLRAMQLAEELLGDLKGKRIAILGLAFKP